MMFFIITNLVLETQNILINTYIKFINLCTLQCNILLNSDGNQSHFQDG